MDNIINLVGIVGSSFIALCLFPQTIKIIQTQSMNDISTPFVVLTMLGALSQLAYGLYYRVLPMIIANVCVSLNTFILLIYKKCYTIDSISKSHLNKHLQTDISL